ncbi:LOW QUALITY PROTEIN: hypothetical protein KUTeg_012253 [Tegillarca granosa]|uniref:Uncharacterized protein n=1 Tax=Tegillarca granosa TaxID=220873 RepID=A0ABQ9EZ08_TEGGR|nr:LOW QUALITY PROTEIN: hypothetical protein KUTeg_012253 [Tegillarca granosa]
MKLQIFNEQLPHLIEKGVLWPKMLKKLVFGIVNTYRPRGRSSYREGRFEERPPTRGPSHERSPFQQDLPQRYRQFREGDGNEWPVDSHERRDVVTRRFTERPHSHSPSFEIDPYRHNSPGRDSPVFSKRRKFKEVPDRSPVNQRHFSPDTFAMNPVSVDDSVGRSAGGNRLSPNTLMRLQQGQGSLFSSELDKLKGYESPEYSDHGDEDNYGDSFNARNDPPKYSQRTEKQPGTQEREPFNQPPKKLQELATSENKFSNSNPNLSKSANRNTGQNLQQRTSSLGKSQTPKTSENVAEETASFEMENEEFVTWTEDNNVETDLDLEEKSKTNGPKQKDSRVPDEVEFQASGRWLGVSKIRWNIKPISDQTKVVVKKKDGATLFVASGTTCRVEKPYKNRIKFHGDTSLGTLNFDLEDCCFADEGLYTGSYENKTFHGPNLKLWTHAIEGETALVLFKMPKMPPNEKVTVYKKNGDTLLIAWGTMAQFTDKYKGKLEYFEKGLIVFSIKNTVQPQSGIYMASVGNNNYEGRQLKVDLPAQKKKRKKKFATSAVKEKGMTDMINFLNQKSKNERVEPSSLSRLANYKSVPLFFDYRVSIPGPAGSRCITGTICAYEDLYLARMSGKSKEEVKPKLLERALSNLLSKTYNQLVQNSFKELELPISLLSNQISKGILQLGGEIAKIPSIKKEDVKTSAVGQKKPTPPVVKQNTSSPTKPATPTTTAMKTTNTPTTTAMKTTNLSSTSGDIKIDLLQANDEKAKEILRSMATSSDTIKQ